MTTIKKFDTIYESFVNGQLKQTQAQFKKLKKADRKECIKYLQDTEHGSNNMRTAANYLFELL